MQELPELPSHVLRYTLRARSHRVGLRLATVCRYVSSADTIDVVVYQNRSVTAGSTTLVISLDDEIQRSVRSLEAALREGTISGYEIPIKDSISFSTVGKLQLSLPGRRVVAVTRSAAGNTSVLYIYYYQVGESIIEVRASVPSTKFDDTGIADFVNAVLEDATDGMKSPR